MVSATFLPSQDIHINYVPIPANLRFFLLSRLQALGSISLILVNMFMQTGGFKMYPCENKMQEEKEQEEKNTGDDEDISEISKTRS